MFDVSAILANPDWFITMNFHVRNFLTEVGMEDSVPSSFWIVDEIVELASMTTIFAFRTIKNDHEFCHAEIPNIGKGKLLRFIFVDRLTVEADIFPFS